MLIVSSTLSAHMCLIEPDFHFAVIAVVELAERFSVSLSYHFKSDMTAHFTCFSVLWYVAHLDHIMSIFNTSLSKVLVLSS
jgi:hypothetical protein